MQSEEPCFTYLIEYQTDAHYSSWVEKAAFELLVLPCDNETQALKAWDFFATPTFNCALSLNKYDFNTLQLRSKQGFENLSIRVICMVEKNQPSLLLDAGLSAEEENVEMTKIDHQLHFFPFLQPTALTQVPLTDLQPAFLKSPDEPLAQYLPRLNAAIHSYLTYQPEITDTQSTALDILHGKKGVCQDYSHLMLAILRTQRITARYVSGYLQVGQEPASAQLHAWVEVFIPQLGWRGFDPTNCLQEDHKYLKIAHGADYQDCASIKGVLKGGGTQEANYSVRVSDGLDYQQALEAQQQ
jgi:hypothetical protein